MNGNFVNRLVSASMLGALLLAGTSVPASAQQGQKKRLQAVEAETKQAPVKKKARVKTDATQVQTEGQVQTQRQPKERVKVAPTQTTTTVAPRVRQREVKPQPEVVVKPRVEPQVRQQAVRPQRIEQQQPANRVNPVRPRLSEQRQRQLIDENRRRALTYRERLANQQARARERAAELQRQRRLAQWRYQQEYAARLQQQQVYWSNQYNSYNYNSDPFFYTAPSYRYSRAGRYYSVNQYQANMLQQAIQYGYQEGLRAAQADREDRWGYNYQSSFVYSDANFGYNGFYVDQDSYNYYFREGFRRGYEDGYYSRNSYGSYDNGRASILGAVVSTILGLVALND